MAVEKSAKIRDKTPSKQSKNHIHANANGPLKLSLETGCRIDEVVHRSQGGFYRKGIQSKLEMKGFVTLGPK